MRGHAVFDGGERGHLRIGLLVVRLVQKLAEAGAAAAALGEGGAPHQQGGPLVGGLFDQAGLDARRGQQNVGRRDFGVHLRQLRRGAGPGTLAAGIGQLVYRLVGGVHLQLKIDFGGRRVTHGAVGEQSISYGHD